MRLSIPVVLLFSLISIDPMFAQSFQGSLRGRVLDSSGEAAAAARVTITDQGTRETRNTITNDLGEYAFSAVNPSLYTLAAERPGFKKLERRSVEIATQANVTLDLTLELGQITESVNVTAEAPALQTADASTGQEIDNQKITDLPNLGRNPYFAGKLAQSVVFVANPKFARMQDQNGNSQVSIGGGPLRTNNYLVDGISITDSNNRAVIVPSPEAVEEMKIQASTYDAEVGRTGGGSFNTLLRGGTNALHGSAVGHIRETSWNANSFFANKAGQPIAAQPFRDWAFSLGGPVVLPKIYDGHNKTFFFASDESYREVDGSTTTLSVPTALERTGNFSQSFTKTGALQTVYDPLSTNLTTGARTPFANNTIPPTQLSQAGLQLASYYPSPNGPTPYYGAPNYTFTDSYPNRGDQRIFKADHQFTQWLRASGSYIHQKTFEVDAPGNIFPNAVFASPSQTFCCDRKIDATQANATATPNSTTVITVRWGFNRFYSKSTQQSAGFNLASLGLPASLVAATPNPAFPAITLGSAVSGCSSPSANVDFANFGGGCTAQDVFYSHAFNVGVAKFLGRHRLKAGFETRTIHDIGTPASGPTSLGFTDVFTRATPQVATSGTGSDLATLLLGYPTSGQQSVVSRFNDFVTYYGGYVQDDFRVTPKLSLNLGLRFEYESGIHETNNKLIVGLNPATPSPLQVPGLNLLGGVQYAGVNGAPTQTGNALAVKPAPRVGFAYAANDKTVIRGGYGIYWVPTFFNYQNAIGYSQTTSIVASTNGNFTPAASITNPYPNGLLQPTGNSLGALSGIGQAITIFNPQTQSAGYVQEYSLEVQRQIPAGFVLTVGVLGSHALHLLQNGQNIDQLNPGYFSQGSALTQSVSNPLYGNGGVGTVGTPTVSRLQLLLPFPQYTSVTLANSGTASSLYYSFYFRAQKKYSNGISLLASFTHSRGEDNVTGSSTAGASQVAALAGPQNAYNLNGEWSLATQDVPNRFTTAFTYELPFGRGKRFLADGRLLSLVVGGWSVNAVNIVQTGFPLSVTQPNNNSVIGASYQRPNATGISPGTSGSTDARLSDWINPAAFSLAPAYTFGNTSRFLTLRGPGLYNWDVSLFKSFSIRERVKAQFRAEALNATNTPYFGNPNTTLNSATFGVITSQINNPRMLQLGTRITF
jgi:trimeric autotransporter adhesin